MNQIRSSPLFVCLVFMLALLAGAASAFAVQVEHITSPRPSGWTVDYTGSIPPGTLQEIDRLGDQIHAANGAELVVVVIDSTGGEPSRDFAIRLFNHWGLDESAQGKGLLLFAALGDRSAEIVLGREIDTPANNQASEAIMQGEMVPRFRDGHPGGALLEGARACSRHILALDVAPLPAETATPLPPRAAVPEQPQPDVAAQNQPDPDGNTGIVLATLAGLGGLTGAYFFKRAPRCKQCRIPMSLMEEQQDDAHLTPPEKTEERIGSMDHQIWVCPQCGESRKRARFRFSNYSRCSSCQAKAVQSTSTVIVSPTYSSSGTKRVDTSCSHCGHQGSSTQTIPRLQRSSSSGSSSSRSSSSRSSSSGGGSSSRGGASGKW